MRSRCILLLVFSLLRAFSTQASAVQSSAFENSDPYVSLSVDGEVVEPGDKLTYTISFGNRGAEAAENITLTLNQPMDGRAPLQYESSDRPPTRWFSTEYGNLPEFTIPLLDTDEATQSGEITITSVVRDSAAPQHLRVTTSLEAPKREIGKRLIVSSTVTTRIVVPGFEEEGSPSGETSFGEYPRSAFATPSADTVPPQKPEASLRESFLSSEALWSTAAFIAVATLLIFAFLAGRRSKAR